jgi:4'-phosphopantetheinyl transferase
MTRPGLVGRVGAVRPTVWVREPDGEPRAAAHDLVRRAAAPRLGTVPEEVELGHDRLGRPCLIGLTGPRAAQPQVSLSHGGGLVAVALTAHGPVGVDVERIRPVPALALAARWFSAPDADWLAGRYPGHQVEAFFWLWTQKEAVGKALGIGLRGGGMRRPVPRPERWPVTGLVPRPVPGHPGLVVATGLVPGHPGAMLAVAYQGMAGDPPLRVEP